MTRTLAATPPKRLEKGDVFDNFHLIRGRSVFFTVHTKRCADPIDSIKRVTASRNSLAKEEAKFAFDISEVKDPVAFATVDPIKGRTCVLLASMTSEEENSEIKRM